MCESKGLRCNGNNSVHTILPNEGLVLAYFQLPSAGLIHKDLDFNCYKSVLTQLALS